MGPLNLYDDPLCRKYILAPLLGEAAPVVVPVDPKAPKGKGGKITAGQVSGGVSGGVPSGAAQNPPKVVAVSPASSGGGGAAAVAPEPPSPFKLARLNASPASPVVPSSSKPVERPVVEKPKRRPVSKAEAEDREEEDSAPKVVKSTAPAPKAEKVVEKKSVDRERVESRPERVKAPVPAASQGRPESAERPDPGSLPPNESLRKLFNPHG